LAIHSPALLALECGEGLDVHHEDGQPIKGFADRLHLSRLCLVGVSHPTDNPMGYIVGHVFGYFLGHPVAVHTLWCNDQGEVDLAPAAKAQQDCRSKPWTYLSHLHEIAVGSLEHPSIEGLDLVVVWFRFKEVC
jgi:hypothetical protein